MWTASRKPRRTPNACIPCRQSKIKCSGYDPCSNCQRRRVQCRFAETGSKVLVSERYLRDLQNQAKRAQRSFSGRHERRPISETEDETGKESEAGANQLTPYSLSSKAAESPISSATESHCSIWTSPFTLPSTVIKNTHTDTRNWIWLAPASPWSFTARLTVMMTERLGINPPSPGFPDLHLDGDIYQIDWNDTGVLDPLSISGLPSLDYALYLFEVTRFHLGQIYRIFEADSFRARLHDLYHCRDPAATETSRIWFVQFLLVLAFGKAFVSRKNCPNPPGSRFFARAMCAMPKHLTMGKDCFVLMEALALASLYLYAVDYREDAHIKLGQAMRIAQLDGLHTQLPEGDLGSQTVARCQNLWWSLYILDRQLSFSLGLPMATQDAEITTLIKAPEDLSPDSIFSLQVKLSQMQTFILSEIYRTEKTQLGHFLEVTRDILQTMAGLAEEIEKISAGDFHGSMDNTVPQETRHVILLYHQCVIIATRPLLLSVLKERLEKLGREEEDWQKFLTLPKSLISIGINSARKTLQTLSDENAFVEVFLPCDLEFTFAAALHLTMGSTLFPQDTTADIHYNQVAHSILDDMIANGNRVAEIRKNELQRLENLFQELDARVKQGGLRTLTLLPLPDADPGVESASNQEMPLAIEPGEILSTLGTNRNMRPTTVSSAEEPMQGTLDSFYSSMGISSYEFLSIADQIGNNDISCGWLDSGAGWLDGDEMAGSY